MSKKMTKAQYAIADMIRIGVTVWAAKSKAVQNMQSSGWLVIDDQPYLPGYAECSLAPAGFIAMQEYKAVSK